MKIASWNVNSIRARLDHVTAWLKHQQPDVLLMQELKAEEFPALVFQGAGLRERGGDPEGLQRSRGFIALPDGDHQYNAGRR